MCVRIRKQNSSLICMKTPDGSEDEGTAFSLQTLSQKASEFVKVLRLSKENTKDSCKQWSVLTPFAKAKCGKKTSAESSSVAFQTSISAVWLSASAHQFSSLATAGTRLALDWARGWDPQTVWPSISECQQVFPLSFFSFVVYLSPSSDPHVLPLQ